MNKDKSLALFQGCSIRSWDLKGIKTFSDIICNGALILWCDLSQNFIIPPSNWRTYVMLKNACNNVDLSRPCVLRDDKFISYIWVNGSPLCNLTAKVIYNSLLGNEDLILHLNIA